MKYAVHLQRNIVIVSFVALASGFGQDLITPILPAYLTLLGLDRAGIGLIDGLLQGATSLFRFISGVLSDKFHNRKWFVFAGYLLSSVSRPFLAFTSSFSSVAFLRILDGVGKGSKDAPRDALIADSAGASVRGRAFGFHRLVDTAGSVFGPLLAASILLSLQPGLGAYRLIFALAAIPGAIALGLILFGVREPKPVVRQQPKDGQTLPGIFWLFCVTIVLITLARMNDSLMLLRATDLGIPSSWAPLLFAGWTLIYALLSYPIGIWSDRVGRRLPLIIGWLLLGLVELGLSVSGPLHQTVLLFAFYGAALALTEGSGRAIISDLVPPEARGRAFAVFYTFTGLAVIVGGYGLGRISDVFTAGTAFRFSAIGVICMSALFFAATMRMKKI